VLAFPHLVAHSLIDLADQLEVFGVIHGEPILTAQVGGILNAHDDVFAVSADDLLGEVFLVGEFLSQQPEELRGRCCDVLPFVIACLKWFGLAHFYAG